jgi:hypothetical protein
MYPLQIWIAPKRTILTGRLGSTAADDRGQGSGQEQTLAKMLKSGHLML